MNSDALYTEMSYLILLFVEGKIQKEQFERLDALLQTSAPARELYFEIMNVHLGLESLDIAIELHEKGLPCCFDTAALEALAEYEKVAPVVKTAAPEELKELPLPVVQPPKNIRRIRKSSVLSIAAVAAAILFVVLFTHFVPVPSASSEVATLTDSVGAKWADSSAPVSNGMRLLADGMPLTLREGLITLKFDTHARVVIESPAEFQLLTEDQIKLRYGRLYATVPREAIGFTVNTQTAKIIDLGTEFGIQADINGDTHLHVVQGKTTLIAGRHADKISIEVNKGSAKKVSGTTSAVSDIPFNDRLFARTINSVSRYIWRGETVRIDLADVVGGGNGMGTGKIGSGISLTNGSCVADFNWSDRRGSGSYLPVEALPVVDGVIVPDSEDGTLPVSSAGHVFRECPNTNGLYYDEIRNGGSIRMTDTKSSFPMLFNGITYGTAERPLLFMHANACITFDLDAIRSAMPGFSVTGFRSRCILIEKSDRIRTEKSDIFVLVDGKVKFKQYGFDRNGVALNVDIPLNDNNRFLTLMATDSGDSIAIDWVGFAEPYVLLESVR